VAVLLRNALDTEYAKPGGWEHRQAALAQDGRTLGVEVQWRF
jgi:hypothetical protein